MRAQHAGTGSLQRIGEGLKKAQEEQPTQTLAPQSRQNHVALLEVDKLERLFLAAAK